MAADELKRGLRAALASGAEGPATVDRILRAARAHLGMEVAFISEFMGGNRRFRHVDTDLAAPPLHVGDTVPLDVGYCQLVVDGHLPELIPDTAAVPAAMSLSVTKELPIGAHVSVPIRLRDGRVYGTFCCFSRTPDLTLGERDLGVMRALADITGDVVQRDIELQREMSDKRARVRVAIDDGQVSLAFQPILDVRDHQVRALECLARFATEPYRGPDIWFAEAEEVGLGAELQLHAIRLALAALPQVPEGVRLNVNASPALAVTGDLARVLAGAPLARLVLEITEHASTNDYGELNTALDPLRAAGLALAVDDAGAGFASFRHVLNLKPDYIKLDISLTRTIDVDPARFALASALIGFARETGSKIVAEGVESASELRALEALGVDKIQGYFLARPMPLEQALGEIIRRAA